MNCGYPHDWPEVTESEFERLCKTFHFRRTAYGDVIIYNDLESGSTFGYEVGYNSTRDNTMGYVNKNPLKYIVHPDLQEETS